MRMLHEGDQRGAGRARGDDGGRRPGSRIQLAPLSPEHDAKFLDRSGPGIQQMAYRVADIDAVSATQGERGLRLLYDAPKRGRATAGSTSSTPRTPAASLVELVEPAGEPGH